MEGSGRTGDWCKTRKKFRFTFQGIEDMDIGKVVEIDILPR